MDVQMPDGTVIQGVPEGVTKSQLMAKYGKLQPQSPDAGVSDVDISDHENPSFLGEMGANFGHALHSAQDIATGNFQDIGSSQTGPKGQVLADALFPEGSDGSFMGALRNVGNTSRSDWTGALNEKLGETLPGKALSVLGGINPVWNAAGTAINRYANPAIEEATGINPENLQFLETVLPIAGIKQAGKVSDPTIAALKGAGNAIAGRKSAPAIPTAADIRTQSGALFNQADQLGGTLQPHITNAWINKAASVLPQTSAGKTVLGETPATQLVGRLDQLRDKPLTLSEAQEIDSALGEMANSQVDAKTGHYNAEGYKLLDIQHSLRDSIENASAADITGGKAGFDTLVKARNLWAASARMADVERVINRAEGRDNPATILKNGFSTLANNAKHMKGYSAEEKAAIQRAAKTGIVTGALRVAGSRLVPIGAGTAGSVGGPVGALASATVGYGISEASRALANHLQLKRSNNVRATIAKRTQAPKQQRAVLPRVAVKARNIGRQTPRTVLGAAVGGNLTQGQP